MPHFIYTTDLHLNFLNEGIIKNFCKEIRNSNPLAFVIGGDTSEAPQFIKHMEMLRKNIMGIPIFFVMGNHDYYRSSVTKMRNLINSKFVPCSTIDSSIEGGHWLGNCGIVALNGSTALVGHDGWYDGGYGNWFQSELDMSDYYVIQELTSVRCPVKQLRFDAMQAFAKESADYVKTQLIQSYQKGFRKVFVATHVAPFPELSVYNGKISNSVWLPCFSSKHMGDILLEVSSVYPELNITILSGHSHGYASCKFSANLDGMCGEAEYGYYPKLYKIEF